jgi:serine/threonine-protein kinase SRK2
MTTKGQTYDGKISDIWSCGVMLYVMLVGGYPFERPEDKHDQQKLQKMIQRILKVEYDFPSNLKVSKSCRDLLSKILVDKPEKRITIAEIQKHPWYVEDLPPGVAEMNDNLPSPGPEVQSAEQITAIVEEARKSAQGVADWDNDEYLDGALNQEDYAGSYDEWGMNGSI